MNKERRKLLDEAIRYLEGVDWEGVDNAKALVAQAAEEEREYADSQGESFSGTARAERAEEVADQLESAHGLLDELPDFQEIIGELQSAAE